MAYTDTHRHVLQFFMKEGYVEKKRYNQILSEYKKKHRYEGDESGDQFIHTINSNLEPLHLAIKVLPSHPRTKETFFGLVNEKDDDISKLATTYTAHEIAFFKKILALIVEKDNEGTEVETVDVLNERDNKAMSMDEAEKTMNNLIREGWLAKTAGKIWYGVRTLLDLRMYLQEQFDVDVFALMTA